MTDSNTNAGIAREISHSSVAHTFTFTFSLPNPDSWVSTDLFSLADLAPGNQIESLPNRTLNRCRTFRQEFWTGCPSCPSSWLIEMVFQKLGKECQVSIPITLKRTDSSRHAVKVLLHPQIEDQYGLSLTNFWTMGPDEIGGGKVLEKCLENRMSDKTKMYWSRIGPVLHVRLFIFVMCCHSPNSYFSA